MTVLPLTSKNYQFVSATWNKGCKCWWRLLRQSVCVCVRACCCFCGKIMVYTARGQRARRRHVTEVWQTLWVWMLVSTQYKTHYSSCDNRHRQLCYCIGLLWLVSECHVLRGRAMLHLSECMWSSAVDRNGRALFNSISVRWFNCITHTHRPPSVSSRSLIVTY